jgi:glutathione S-transferase
MLTVFGRRNSINVQKVMWLVAELELEHEHVPRGGSFGGLDTPEFRAMNPHGRVPVIDDSGVLVWESHAILRYLAAQYSSGRFWPASPAERARIEPWMDWVATRLQPDFTDSVFWAMYRTPEAQRNWPAIRRGLERTARDLQVLEEILCTQPFLAGDTLSLADIPAGAQLFRYFTLDIERPSLRYVEAWYARLQARPAYRDHVMVPYDDLRGRLAF